MKVKKKCCLSLLLVLMMVLQTFLPLKSANAAVDVVKSYQENYNITASQLKAVQLGSPSVIYELNKSVQDEIYYFPLLDSNKNIILLMSVIGTTTGWSLSASDQWVNDLKKLGNITSDYIFYKSGDNLAAESQNAEYTVTGTADSKINFFSDATLKSVLYIIKKVKAIMVFAGQQRSLPFVTTSVELISLQNRLLTVCM